MIITASTIHFQTQPVGAHEPYAKGRDRWRDSPDNDQFFRFESGHGKCVIDGNEYELKEGDAVVIPAGAKHNIINTDEIVGLKLYTLYSPAHHKDGIIRSTKKEAEKDGEEFDGVTTESSKKHVVRESLFSHWSASVDRVSDKR